MIRFSPLLLLRDRFSGPASSALLEHGPVPPSMISLDIQLPRHGSARAALHRCGMPSAGGNPVKPRTPVIAPAHSATSSTWPAAHAPRSGIHCRRTPWEASRRGDLFVSGRGKVGYLVQ